MKHSRYFSLIELMVILAIIAILLSLLLPSLGKARETARIAVCTSNAKQQGVGLSAYASDNRSYYPEYTQRNTGFWLGKTGTDGKLATEKQLNEYFGIVSDGAEAPFAQCISESPVLDEYNDHGSSYRFNQKRTMENFSAANADAGIVKPLKNTMLPKPSLFLVGGERGGVGMFSNPGNFEKPTFYHHTDFGDKRFVFQYGDGHAKYTRIWDEQNTSTYMWENGR